MDLCRKEWVKLDVNNDLSYLQFYYYYYFVLLNKIEILLIRGPKEASSNKGGTCPSTSLQKTQEGMEEIGWGPKLDKKRPNGQGNEPGR